MATAVSDNDDDSPCEDSPGSASVSCDDSDTESNSQRPCKYYNKGHCRNGAACLDLHVCQYALNGNCRYGSSCKLNHSQSTSTGPKLTDGRKYQWQLDYGSGWRDINNDHIIEAQYCLPHTKSIKIYNTPHGAVNIDFTRMRVIGKKLSVRRLDDGCTTWVWYCTLKRKWRKYGEKGDSGPVTSSDIEKMFQRNPGGSFSFSIGGENLEIIFREMRQVGKKKKRKVTRRPVYQQPAAAGVSQVTSTFQKLSLANKPQWEFQGNGDRWHVFKTKGGTCSVSSDDIERNYQQNNKGHMTFTVNGQQYKLDFEEMKQTNLVSKKTRKIRRV